MSRAATKTWISTLGLWTTVRVGFWPSHWPHRCPSRAPIFRWDSTASCQASHGRRGGRGDRCSGAPPRHRLAGGETQGRWSAHQLRRKGDPRHPSRPSSATFPPPPHTHTQLTSSNMPAPPSRGFRGVRSSWPSTTWWDQRCFASSASAIASLAWWKASPSLPFPSLPFPGRTSCTENQPTVVPLLAHTPPPTTTTTGDFSFLMIPQTSCACTPGHVQAKRYLTFKVDGYYEGLSSGSKFTLSHQVRGVAQAEPGSWPLALPAWAALLTFSWRAPARGAQNPARGAE